MGRNFEVWLWLIACAERAEGRANRAPGRLDAGSSPTVGGGAGRLGTLYDVGSRTIVLSRADSNNALGVRVPPRNYFRASKTVPAVRSSGRMMGSEASGL
jgi:hypothetical protein